MREGRRESVRDRERRGESESCSRSRGRSGRRGTRRCAAQERGKKGEVNWVK